MTELTFPLSPQKTRLVWLPVWLGFSASFTVIGFFYAISKWIELSYSKQILKPNSIYRSEGFFNREITEMNYSDIQHVACKQHWMEKFLGYGNVFVVNKQGRAVVFRFLRDPKKVERIIREKMVEKIWTA